jgi:F0F1-type ATP synthase assembly protein I
MEPKQDPQSSPTPRQDPPIGGPETLRGITWGLEFGLTIAVFVGIGYFADQKLGTGPWLLVLSLFLGFGGALYSLVRKADRTSTPRPSKAGASKGTSPDSGVKRP